MRRIRVQNPTVEATYRTYLNADYSTGTSATVANNASFAANDLGLFGAPTEELTEIKKISAISGSTVLTLASTLNFAHTKNTPVYKILWDNVSIEGRSSSAGVFTELTQSGLQYDNKLNETVYYHSSGTDSWEYRFRFYNSVTTTYSEYSPTLTGAAQARNTVGYMITNVRKLTGDIERKVVTDEEIMRAFNDAQDIIYTHNTRYWFLYVDTYQGNNGIAATVSEDVYSLNQYTTLGVLATIRFRYHSGGTDNIYHLRKKAEVEFDSLIRDQNRSTDNWPTIYKLLPVDSSSDKGYFQVDPVIKTTGVGTFYPNYYEKMADLNSVDDTTQVPIPSLLEALAIAYIEKIKGNEKKASLYESMLISDNERVVPRGLVMLDKMDNAQRDATGQPKSLWRYQGQRAVANLYGAKTPQSADYVKENYFDGRFG